MKRCYMKPNTLPYPILAVPKNNIPIVVIFQDIILFIPEHTLCYTIAAHACGSSSIVGGV